MVVADMCSPPDADPMVLTCEDKDPSVLWGSSLDGLISRWFSLLSTQPRWKIGGFGVDSLLGCYRHWINNCLPRSLKPPECLIFDTELPYIYPTVKRKCFNGWQGCMKTCIKPGHSCFRNVCSFRKLPCRHTSDTSVVPFVTSS